MTAWLCAALAEHGLRCGIVSRGYGGSLGEASHRVVAGDSASLVGDEPLMLARKTGVPVVVCRHRARAVAQLAQSGEVDVVLSDDGLQHHAMARDKELVVVDAVSGFGNGWRLPAGPLRESVSRLDEVDLVVHQRGVATEEHEAQASFLLELTTCRHLLSDALSPLSGFANQRVHAVAAIGRPARVFDALRHLGIDVIEHALPDHYPLTAVDVCFDDKLPVLVTEKDAVKLDAADSSLDAVQVIETQLLPSTALIAAVQRLADDLTALDKHSTTNTTDAD